MSELRVPTVAQEAEVLCADGRTFHGRIFVPAAASRHEGPTRPAEWMNDAAPFFPFLPDGEEAPVLLNKDEVLVLSVDATLDPPAASEIDAPLPTRNVVVEVRERSINGLLHIDMPAHLSRVVDYLNRSDAFVIVEDEERHHLIRKSRITRVLEPRGQ